MPPVTVVILNWNGQHWLAQFLPSVLASSYPAMRILLVDNGSTDHSVAWVQDTYPEIEVLALPENYGFAEGNNKAIPHIHEPYFVLLNSDVEVSPGWLEPLVAQMESDPHLAAMQPKIRAQKAKDQFEYAGAAGGLLDRYGYPFCRGRIFDQIEPDQGQYDWPMDIFWATGACLMVRTSVVKELGFLDGEFFAHMEEIDFCWRVLNHGHRIMCEPSSVVYHVGGGTLPQGNPRKTYLNVRNGLICMFKNLPAKLVFPRIFVRLVLDGVWATRSLMRGDTQTLGAIFRGHWHFFLRLGHWRNKRRSIYTEVKPHFPLPGYYAKSVVWDFFARKRKTWSKIMGRAEQDKSTQTPVQP